jgi:hypothetical protein
MSTVRRRLSIEDEYFQNAKDSMINNPELGVDDLSDDSRIINEALKSYNDPSNEILRLRKQSSWQSRYIKYLFYMMLDIYSTVSPSLDQFKINNGLKTDFVNEMISHYDELSEKDFNRNKNK